MTAPLSPECMALLDFLCAAKANNCRVTSLKTFALLDRRTKLVKAGLVCEGTHEPTAWAMHDWKVRQKHPRFDEQARCGLSESQKAELAKIKPGDPGTRDYRRESAEKFTGFPPVPQTSAPFSGREPTEPPKPGAEAEGGDASARTPVSPPDLERLLSCFRDEFEKLSIVAERFGAKCSQAIVRHSRMLLAADRIEFLPPTIGRPTLLWRKAQPNTRGASGTAKEAPSAEESTSARRIEDRAPLHEPAPAVAPSARAHPVDIEVNTGAPNIGSELLLRVRATAASRGISMKRASIEIFGNGGQVYQLPQRHGERDQERVRAWLEPPSPPAKPFPVEIRIGPRRDPTQKPDTPLMDLAERQSANARVKAAAIKRGQEREAADRLDAGLKPRNSVEGATMAQIQRRRNDDARLVDPIEQAISIIRRRVPCWRMTTEGGKKGFYRVGGRVLNEADMLSYAEQLQRARKSA